MICPCCGCKKPSQYMYVKVGYATKVCKNCFIGDDDESH